MRTFALSVVAVSFVPFALAGAPPSTEASSHSQSSTMSADGRVYRTVGLQIVHRHGDRSPITPLKDEDFWANQLVPDSLLAKIAENTEIIEADSENRHKANGRGPFGKLTELGLLQMISVGNTLREKFSSDTVGQLLKDDDGSDYYPHVWNPDRPLSPANIRIFSTNFARTIQSVQGLLVGLFPDGTKEQILIDVRNTDWMIPDPQPRQTKEQQILESKLGTRPHLQAKEKELRPLAQRATESLQPFLADDAREVSYGVAESHNAEVLIEVEPLSWNQLAEITKCLSVRDMLPAGISQEDQEAISKHAAWRWFENLKVPRLVHLAMNKFVAAQLGFFLRYKEANEPPVTIWSAHDSALIGLLCAYRLEMPAVWPEYASYLIIELIEVQDVATKDLALRFSLNGEYLRSVWDEKPLDMIPLSSLHEKMAAHGATSVE